MVVLLHILQQLCGAQLQEYGVLCAGRTYSKVSHVLQGVLHYCRRTTVRLVHCFSCLARILGILNALSGLSAAAFCVVVRFEAIQCSLYAMYAPQIVLLVSCLVGYATPHVAVNV